MKYTFIYTNKYDKLWLDDYTDGQVKKLIESILSSLGILKVEKQNRDIVMETEIEQFIKECAEYIKQKLIEGVK